MYGNNYWRTSLLLSLRIHGKTNSNKIKMDNTIARKISIFVADVCTMCGKQDRSKLSKVYRVFLLNLLYLVPFSNTSYAITPHIEF